jgi:hypothetical protein
VGGEQALKALRLASLIEQLALDGTAWSAKPVELDILDPQVAVV